MRKLKLFKVRHYLVVIFLTALTGVIYSCKKDIFSFASTPINNMAVAGAKTWYENTYPQKGERGDVRNNSTNADGTQNVDLSQLIRPDWDKATSYRRFTDSVIEVPHDEITNLGIKLVSANTGIAGNIKYSSAHFLLLKNRNGYNAYIMVLAGDSSYIQGDPSKLANNHYNKRDVNFSGSLMYFTLGGKLVNGWLYKQGKITGRYITEVQAATINNTKRAQDFKAKNGLLCSYLYIGEEPYMYLNSVTCITFPDYNPGETGGTGGGSDSGSNGPAGDGGGGTGGNGNNNGTTNPSPCVIIRSNSITTNVIKTNSFDNEQEDDGGYPNPNGGGNSTNDPCAGASSIIKAKLNPCMTTVLQRIQTITGGSVMDIVRKFSGNISGYNWTVQDGRLDPYVNANTNSQYDKSTMSVITTFDSQKFGSATDLSIARTILHESIHAYLIAYFANDPVNASKSYYDMLVSYGTMSPNDAQHTEMAKFLGGITNSLTDYAKSMNYDISDPTFYYSLAWGGLTTDVNGNDTQIFQTMIPDPSTRNYIKNVILIEQTGKDSNGDDKTQKGNKAGC